MSRGGARYEARTLRGKMMIRRVLATVAVAFAVAAVPLAAQAADPYPAPTPTVACSATQVEINATFTCTVTGEEGKPAVLQVSSSNGDVTIAGTTTSAPKNITGGEANFTLTAPAVPSQITITATVGGVSVQTQAAVSVVDELSGTGFDNMGLLIGAVVLVVGGGAVVFATTRRRSQQKVNQTV